MMPEPTCPRCMTAVERDFDYCPNCDMPLSETTALDPMNTIRTEGAIFRSAANPRSKVVVIGMWIIFGPGILAGAALLYAAGDEWTAVAIPAGVIFLFYGAILFKTTRNYVRHRRAGDAGQ